MPAGEESIMNDKATEAVATKPAGKRRRRAFVGTILAAATLSGAAVTVLTLTAGSASAEPNICEVSAQNANYYDAEADIYYGNDQSPAELALGNAAFYQAIMWRNIGRGFGCS
jgi:hypothetical protein